MSVPQGHQAAARGEHRHAPVVVESGPWGVFAREASLREVIDSRLHAHRLDHELATGQSPESRPALSLRAQLLARPATRRSLARAVVRLLREATTTRRPTLHNPPLADLASVRAVQDDLEELVDQLVAPAPVSARGVALVNELLFDGSGPLYARRSRDELRARVRAAVRALDPAADWPG